mmetsp:Transcript_25404/g.39886  ORF Transcript_25404/g.39886 Transcript_25404/m.39886 type:complete len:86 (-) Transcript_25404:31-288(-)
MVGADIARDNPSEGGGMLPFELLLRAVISVEEEPFCDECFPPLIASKQEQQAPIVVYRYSSLFVSCLCQAVLTKYRLPMKGLLIG